MVIIQPHTLDPVVQPVVEGAKEFVENVSQKVGIYALVVGGLLLLVLLIKK